MNSLCYITPEEWTLIEDILEQDNPEIMPLLNEKLAQIPNLAEKIEHIKKVREEIEDSIRQSKIKEFHKDAMIDEGNSSQNTIANKKITLNTFWYAFAAAIAVLFGIFWMMELRNTPEKIFAKNFKPDIGLPLKMSTSNAPGFYEGMLDYKQENYIEAMTKWEVLLRSNPENDTLNYFLGVANLALGSAAKSLEYLEDQECFRKGIFKEDAAYYAALAKIKEGKFEEARALLNNYPSVRNKNLLKEIDKY